MYPLKIRFYDPETGDIQKEYSQCYLSWGVLDKAADLVDRFKVKPGGIDERMMEDMCALVVVAFGNRFTVREIKENADFNAVTGIVQTILQLAKDSMLKSSKLPTITIVNN